jgi:dTDP-4-dehydrorhamnose reductase
MTAPILVTGSTGQLGVALAEAAAALGLVLDRVDRPAFDFDRPGSVADVFTTSAPALVVNTAAYTAVDAAEDDADAAFRANRDGPAELARLCEAAGIPLIQISTDYVFDGLKGAPYLETDATSPQGVYGASKLAGEAAVLAGCSRGIVVRTSWLYSPTGKNFVRTMLAAGQRSRELRVVADQAGCPTSATDLARAILGMAARLMNGGWEYRCAGVYHAAGTVRQPGMNWRPRPWRRRRAMARRRRRWCRSRQMNGRPGRSGRPTRGSTAAGLLRCSGCACRRGKTDWRGLSRRYSPRRHGDAGGGHRAIQ